MTPPIVASTGATQPATLLETAVIAVPIHSAPATSASDSRRAPRRICVSRPSTPRKYTCSFGPGRAPVMRSIDSTNRTKRIRTFCTS